MWKHSQKSPENWCDRQNIEQWKVKGTLQFSLDDRITDIFLFCLVAIVRSLFSDPVFLCPVIWIARHIRILSHVLHKIKDFVLPTGAEKKPLFIFARRIFMCYYSQVERVAWFTSNELVVLIENSWKPLPDSVELHLLLHIYGRGGGGGVANIVDICPSFCFGLSLVIFYELALEFGIKAELYITVTKVPMLRRTSSRSEM